MFRFDSDSIALPLEGSVGSGDRGAPSVTIKDSTPMLIGIASWQQYDGDLKDYVEESMGLFLHLLEYHLTTIGSIQRYQHTVIKLTHTLSKVPQTAG